MHVSPACVEDPPAERLGVVGGSVAGFWSSDQLMENYKLCVDVNVSVSHMFEVFIRDANGSMKYLLLSGELGQANTQDFLRRRISRSSQSPGHVHLIHNLILAGNHGTVLWNYSGIHLHITLVLRTTARWRQFLPTAARAQAAPLSLTLHRLLLVEDDDRDGKDGAEEPGDSHQHARPPPCARAAAHKHITTARRHTTIAHADRSS
ncbi:Protein of unknown function [Gryllus bimaculatus]|nr:Protein of unknown function [Gryllus bimaculatus]